MEEKNETHTPLNRRQFLKLAGVAGSAALLAGCANKATETPAEVATEEKTAEEAPAEAAAPAGSRIVAMAFCEPRS